MVATRAWLALAFGTILAAIAIWIVVPAPTRLLLPLGVGAPEIAPTLLLLALLVAVMAAADARASAPARLAMGLALGTGVLASLPLLRFPDTVRRGEAAMATGLGDGYWDEVPAAVRAGVRAKPLTVAELFTGVRPGPARVMRDVPMASVDGESLTIDVYLPPAKGIYPTVVQIYGGAWQRGAPGDNAVVAQELASRGFAVFAIDYRHAPRWRWPAQLADVRLALRWVREHAAAYGADSSRVALLGRSSGAQLAMLAAYEPGAPEVRAVVNYYGPVDLADGYRHPPTPDPLDVRAVEIALFGGPPERLPEAYRSASPIAYVAGPPTRFPPTLSIYGSRDHVVLPRYGERLHERLTAAGARSVLLQIPWAEHAFDALPSGPSAQLALYYTERFLAWAFASPKERCSVARDRCTFRMFDG